MRGFNKTLVTRHVYNCQLIIGLRSQTEAIQVPIPTDRVEDNEMTEYIPSHILRKSVIARPIKRVPAPKPRTSKRRIELLRRIAEGGTVNRFTAKEYLDEGLVQKKYITELVLTSKGRKLIET